MKTSIRTLILCAGAFALMALPALAQGGPGSCRRGGVCANLPGVTEAQKTAFAALEAKHRPDMEAKRKAVREAHDALRQAMAKPGADLKALFDKESQARFALLEARQANRMEMEKLLTPEQKAQWEKRWSEGPGMGRGMGHGRGMGRGNGACPQGMR
ncbi:Spy/CpxP family protein refolding chaperone [Geothrix sp. 21YS21S-2]|uniref:Spy/CpxP family protein refolding chaperone n=1 Tax=Geothrix sp. 21YS21S-2 TaxID=3068893 RepID=UPI0027BA144C|nr:Spy/CpxP family protein refolding chaperone [Geothrix sp. 21YS21S-2]